MSYEQVWLVLESDWDYGPAPVACYRKVEDAKRHAEYIYGGEYWAINIHENFNPDHWTAKFDKLRQSHENEYYPE